MMRVVYAQSGDLKAIAKCHRSAFSDSLSSKLGLSYCIKMLNWYIEGQGKFLFSIMDNGECIGYCGGATRMPGANLGSASSLAQYTMIKGLIAICVRPWLFFTKEAKANYEFVFRNIKRKLGLEKKRTKPPKPAPHYDSMATAGLVVIGVSPQYQGKGIGSQLLQEFERKAIEMGIKHLHLSVKETNDSALRSYLRNGWKVYENLNGLMFLEKFL
jgi:GNAT superfamily N-acetyltransferase